MPILPRLILILLCFCFFRVQALQGKAPPATEGSSPLAVCTSYLDAIAAGRLGAEFRAEELQKLEQTFKKAYPRSPASVSAAFLALKKASPSAPHYHWQVENLARELNLLTFAAASFSPLAKDIWDMWQQYPNPRIRAPLAIDKKDECIEPAGQGFRSFVRAPLSIIGKNFKSLPFAAPAYSVLEKVAFLPAGSLNYFGATASSQRGRARVCVNPEEAPPFLVPKLLHELTHASNQSLWLLRNEFMEAYKSWHNSYKLLGEKETNLFDFDEKILLTEHLEAAALTEEIIKLKAPSLEELSGFLQAKAGKQKAYTNASPDLFNVHAELLLTWHRQFKLTEKLYQTMLTKRLRLDRERYLDEHRAYAVEYQAALHLLKSDPEFFCKLWVPSYPQKRPVRFYQAYLELEARLMTKSFSSWLGELYTVKTNRYLPASIYHDGQQEKGIRGDLLKRGTAILSRISFVSSFAPPTKE